MATFLELEPAVQRPDGTWTPAVLVDEETGEVEGVEVGPAFLGRMALLRLEAAEQIEQWEARRATADRALVRYQEDKTAMYPPDLRSTIMSSSYDEIDNTKLVSSVMERLSDCPGWLIELLEAVSGIRRPTSKARDKGKLGKALDEYLAPIWNKVDKQAYARVTRVAKVAPTMRRVTRNDDDE